MTRYIESKPNGDGTFDHTEVREAYTGNRKIFFRRGYQNEYEYIPIPLWFNSLQYKAEFADTYGIHESSSTPREVKGEAGPAESDMEAAHPSDTEMLDWMLKNNGLVELRGGQYYCGYGPYGTVLNGALADSPREAIKAAMQSKEEK